MTISIQGLAAGRGLSVVRRDGRPVTRGLYLLKRGDAALFSLGSFRGDVVYIHARLLVSMKSLGPLSAGCLENDR